MSRKVCWCDADVRCPFYLEGAGASIVCEGCEEDSTLTTRFRLSKNKDRYMGINCAGRYQDCKLYKIINGKYE